MDITSYFRNKCVLVTGGSSGIGLAIARALYPCDAELVLVARNRDRLAAAKQSLESGSRRRPPVTTLAIDVANRGEVSGLLGLLPRPVDVLINNAGVVMPGRFLDLPLAQFDCMMQTNFLGAMHLTQLLLPSMVEARAGHVAFVSSLAGLIGIYGYTAYSASKFALRGFAEALRCELKPMNIQCTICYPPDTDTPQLELENRHKPDETRLIAGTVKALTADEVARALLSGMAARKFHVVPGVSARASDVAYRLFPGVARRMFDRQVSQLRGSV